MEETTAGDAERPISAAAAAGDEADCPGWLHAGLVVAAPAAEAGLELCGVGRLRPAPARVGDGEEEEAGEEVLCLGGDDERAAVA